MTFEEYIEIADKKFNDGLYEEAIKAYDKAIGFCRKLTIT
jgi:hypothetical protein